MTLDEVKEYYGTWINAMDEAGFSDNVWCNWKRRGSIPYHSQLRIEKATNGELKADGVNQYAKAKEKLKKVILCEKCKAEIKK